MMFPARRFAFPPCLSGTADHSNRCRACIRGYNGGNMADIARRLEKAERLLQKHKLEDALEELTLAMQEEPRSELARSKAADLCATLGHNSDAARLYGESFHQLVAGGELQRA